MKKILKVLGLIIAIYIIIGIIFALKCYFSYDPDYTSFPNNLTTFVLNILLWPFNFGAVRSLTSSL
jgi:hypothetical protein